MGLREKTRLGIAIGAVAAVLALTALGCGKDSNSVAGPSTGMASVNVAGVWMGSFQPDDSHRCAGSSAMATLQQNGSAVTGSINTSACGVSGTFTGTLSGNLLTGSIKMAGCTGGGVSGTVGAHGLSLAIGDMTKPLVTGDQVVMAGGQVSLSR